MTCGSSTSSASAMAAPSARLDGRRRFAVRRSVWAMTVVVLLGAPGAGKGTQAPVLAARLGVPVLASGDLLRRPSPMARRSARGRRYMSRGQLVPDDTIVRVFLDRLEAPDAATGAILDGFPRTRVQAEALDAALAEAGTPGRPRRSTSTSRSRTSSSGWPAAGSAPPTATSTTCVSNPPHVAGICDIDGSALVQRADDAEETVRARMAQQVPPLLEVVEHYRDTGVLRTVDGRQAIDDGHRRR